jgi:hypothetical protein
MDLYRDYEHHILSTGDCLALTTAAENFQISDLTDYCVVEAIFSTMLTVDHADVLLHRKRCQIWSSPVSG